MMSSISKKTYEIDDIKHVKKYTLVILKSNKQALSGKMSIISLISTYIVYGEKAENTFPSFK